MSRQDWTRHAGKKATVTWGSSEFKSETFTGTLISAGSTSLWFFTPGGDGKDPQDVFVKYDQIKDVTFR